MTRREFVIPLSDDSQCRVIFVKERGLVMRFTVQQEAFIQGEWRPIVRYDTTHGFVHRDTVHPDGTEDKQLLDFLSYREAFTATIEDIKLKYTFYRRRYERWRMKGEP